VVQLVEAAGNGGTVRGKGAYGQAVNIVALAIANDAGAERETPRGAGPADGKGLATVHVGDRHLYAVLAALKVAAAGVVVGVRVVARCRQGQAIGAGGRSGVALLVHPDWVTGVGVA